MRFGPVYYWSGVRPGCVVAPDLFLTPMDWLLNDADHLAFLSTTVGNSHSLILISPTMLPS